MNFINNKKYRLILIIIIFIQLFYISTQRLDFKIRIIKNSFLKNFGAKYIMSNDLLELKNISDELKLTKFNISNNLENNAFFKQRSIEFLYPIKFDRNYNKIFYSINEELPIECTVQDKFKYFILIEC
jgi:hypothetical protein